MTAAARSQRDPFHTKNSLSITSSTASHDYAHEPDEGSGNGAGSEVEHVTETAAESLVPEVGGLVIRFAGDSGLSLIHI